ncbi:MAG: IS110 family transposase [Anaerolineae bacterium]|nr:IS110 family transposase [Anaerolineae bacterium]
MVYIGIDIAKRSHTALALTADRDIVWSDVSVSNDRDGFEALQQRLIDLDADILVGLEATSIYWLALYAFLIEQEIAVVVFNPLQIHAYRKSGIRKRKDDRIDAFWIADYMRVGHTQMPPQFEPHLMQLRELTRFRAGLTDQLGRVKRQIIGVLDRIFPEYETLFSSIFIQSSRRLLAEAVSPVEFADCDLSELADLLQRSSRGRFGSVKAAEIQATAARSIGVTFLVDALSVQMRCLLGQLDLLEAQRADIDAEIAAFVNQMEQFITTIPGIGPVTGATILAEIGDIERFASPAKLVAYAGIDPSVYQSGQFNAWHTRMSKRGSPYLRHALWQAAVSAIRFDPQLKAYYERRLAEGKHRNVIVGAVCRQLLNRIFVILKEQRPYEIRS